MYLLVTEKKPGVLKKEAFIYLLISLVCMIFGAVYEVFSHGVYSPYMVCAFAAPLTGGTLMFLLLDRANQKVMPGRIPLQLYHAGIATLTVGSIVQGILEIYGTTIRLLSLYWAVGACLPAAGAILYMGGIFMGGDPE